MKKKEEKNHQHVLACLQASYQCTNTLSHNGRVLATPTFFVRELLFCCHRNVLHQVVDHQTLLLLKMKDHFTPLAKLHAPWPLPLDSLLVACINYYRHSSKNAPILDVIKTSQFWTIGESKWNFCLAFKKQK